ncbi:MAG: hypothetical protein KC910_14490, partial [Candidatus Eremiobacteraeota bacterium]|nr:hypothetical protein [Candidatus Eremiobacteraeota bacterium]
GASNRKANQTRNIIGLVCIVLALGGFSLVGRCSQGAVLTSHYGDAQTMYIQRVKGLGSYNSTHHFDAVLKEMDRIGGLAPKWPEPPMYSASVKLVSFQQELARKRPKPELLDEASAFLDECDRRDRKFPPTAYFRAMIAFMQDDEKGAETYLDECTAKARDYYSDKVWADEWVAQCDAARKDIGKGTKSKVKIRCIPTLKMLPKWQIINGA